MVVPQNAIVLAETFEGLVLVRYKCPAGFWTIGYGRRCKEDQEPITEGVAKIWLEQDMTTAMLAVLRYCPILVNDWEMLGAVTDFVYNLGAGRLQTSTMRYWINKGDREMAKRELLRWVRGGGRILKGLVLRRQAEAVFF